MTQAIPTLINVDEFQSIANNNDILLIQVTSEQTFNQAHIENAVHVLPAQLMSGDVPARGSLPSMKQLETMLQNIGFNGQHCVVYDDEGGGWAGRMIWTLHYLNHTKVSYLNGGLHAWHQAGYPLVASTNKLENISGYSASEINEDVRMQAQDIVAHLQTDDFAVWDARSPAEYSGEQVLAQRGGHIPGAVNLEWTELMDRQRGLALKPLEDIQATLNQLGLSKDKTIVTHCQSHHRSGLTYLVASLLGYKNIKAYDGSWSEWGNDKNLPIEL